MLHEILLSLSGLQSPIWNQSRTSEQPEEKGLNQYVSPPEQAMLDILAHLHDLHVKIRDIAAQSTAHPSMVCRAVGSSISNVHLDRFVGKVMQVESLILRKDAGYVGAYDIVPLSTIVSEFAPWTRRLEWLWSVVQHLGPSGHGSGRRQSSGASILDLLEKETHTGYSDIEAIAVSLLEVAQRAWMRTASLWILYGKLPASGAEDFCIKPNPSSSSPVDAFSIDPSLVPKVLNTGAAHALLSCGSALNQLRSQKLSAPSDLKSTNDPAMVLMPAHMRMLQSLRYPLNPSLLESVLTSINQSISENALSQVLPRSMVRQVLQVILRYMLLDHGEFAVSLVAHADERVRSHHLRRTAARPVRKIGTLDHLPIQDIELNTILTKAMADLAALQADDDLDEDIWGLAKRYLSLQPIKLAQGSEVISTLLPNPTSLCIAIPPSSPLQIFLSSQDAQTYALLNGYLLSIRRAGLHLAQLWKLTYYRRCHPAPSSASRARKTAVADRRSRDNVRSSRMRRHWTCASKVLYMINELQAYLQGEVIQSSWTRLEKWIDGEDTAISVSARSSRPGTASSGGLSKRTDYSIQSHYITSSTHGPGPNDPRALADAHRVYLRALTEALFFTNAKFTGTLKELLNQVDHFIALFSRLKTVWEGLDLQNDDGVLDAFANHAQDEAEVLAELDRTRDVIEATLLELVHILREMEREKRSGLGISGLVDRASRLELNGTTFVPWQARTVDRLVMKLDSLAGSQDESSDGFASGMADGYDDE